MERAKRSERQTNGSGRSDAGISIMSETFDINHGGSRFLFSIVSFPRFGSSK